jgi:hypothetical protein
VNRPSRIRALDWGAGNGSFSPDVAALAENLADVDAEDSGKPVRAVFGVVTAGARHGWWRERRIWQIA